MNIIDKILEKFKTKDDWTNLKKKLEQEDQEQAIKQKMTDEELLASNIPHVIIKSTDYEPIKGIKIELDWNDAFVNYLKDNGITGLDEDTIVMKWLQLITNSLDEELQEEKQENIPNDFL